MNELINLTITVVLETFDLPSYWGVINVLIRICCLSSMIQEQMSYYCNKMIKFTYTLNSYINYPIKNGQFSRLILFLISINTLV